MRDQAELGHCPRLDTYMVIMSCSPALVQDFEHSKCSVNISERALRKICQSLGLGACGEDRCGLGVGEGWTKSTASDLKRIWCQKKRRVLRQDFKGQEFMSWWADDRDQRSVEVSMWEIISDINFCVLGDRVSVVEASVGRKLWEQGTRLKILSEDCSVFQVV